MLRSGLPEGGSFLRRRVETRLREVEMELAQLDLRERQHPTCGAG